MLTPFIYVGGKTRLAPQIIALFPKHHTYVEVFGGAGAILFKKSPSACEIFNDINSDIVNLYRVLQDPDKSKRLKDLLTNTLYARGEWERARDILRQGIFHDDISRAWAWFVAYNQSHGGVISKTRGGWGYARVVSRVRGYRSRIDNIDNLTNRLSLVQIECIDCLDILQRYDHANTLFYCDPPYVHETRNKSSRDSYAHEMTDDDHRAFVDTLLNIEGEAIISGFENPIYDPLLDHGWRKQVENIPVTFTTTNSPFANEVIWSSPGCVKQLSFLDR